jgi:predicted TIM-barrel fold metal-dependent hydrolase
MYAVALHVEATNIECDTWHCTDKDANEAQVLEVSLLQQEMQLHKSVDAARRKEDNVLAGMIDTHCHLIPPMFNQWMNEADSWNDDKVFEVEDMNIMLDRMASAGVSAAVLSISPEVSPARLLSDPNEVVEVCSKINAFFASDECRGLTTPSRLGAFAMLPMPDVNATIAEIKRALAPEAYYGQVLDGVGLYTSYDGVRISDPSFTPVWEELNALSAKVFIHPTNFVVNPAPDIPTTTLEFPLETTRTLVLMWRNGVLDKYSNIKFLASHGAGMLPFDVSYIIDHLTSNLDPATTPESLRSVYIDTSKVKAEPVEGALGAMEAFVGHSQILYGSDYPYAGAGNGVEIIGFDIQPGVQSYAQARWTSDQKEAGSHGNALSLFPRFQTTIKADVLASKTGTPLLQMSSNKTK